MLIQNEEWVTHKATGNPTNKFRDENTISMGTANEIGTIICLLPQADKYCQEFKDRYPKTQKNTMQALRFLYVALLKLPYSDCLAIDGDIKHEGITLITRQGLKKVVSKMQDINHVSVFSGFAFKKSVSNQHAARPMAIKLRS